MTSHSGKSHHPAAHAPHKEKKIMDAKDFQPGDAVLVPVLGEEMEGVVRSVQTQKNLVDVQVYKQGHLKHCQTIAFPPEQVKARRARKGGQRVEA
jgi:hypothetical protein